MVKYLQIRQAFQVLRNLLLNNGLETKVHSMEVGRRGKPDEFEDGLAMKIGAYFLEKDPDAKFDLDVTSRWDGGLYFNIGGEVTDTLLLGDYVQDITSLVGDHYRSVNLSSAIVPTVNISFNKQSAPLSKNGAKRKNGDAGHAIGVAYANGLNYLPAERYVSVGLRDLLDQIFQDGGKVPKPLADISGVENIIGLASDGKIQVDAEYSGADLIGLSRIIFAVAQRSIETEELREKLSRLANGYILLLEKEKGISLGRPEIYINGAGTWPEEHSGAKADDGSREAKPHRHLFQTYGVATDSITGEDPSKPDMVAGLLARYIAVQVAGNNLADFAAVSISYVIGHDDFKISVNTNSTGKISQRNIERWIKENVPLNIKEIVDYFDLRNSKLYLRIAQNSDFFQDPSYRWNKLEIKYQK